MKTILAGLGIGALLVACGGDSGGIGSHDFGQDFGGLCSVNEAYYRCQECLAQGFTCPLDPLCNPYVCGPSERDLSASQIDLGQSD